MDAANLLTSFNLDSKGFKQLLDSQSLVDCTLACDGGKISAHKIVLSACSSYLAKILLEHPVEHPIIILPELNINDVKTLIHYMYTGELLKSNSQLHSSSLLKTAAILSVNSLNDFLNGNFSPSHHCFGGSTQKQSNNSLLSADHCQHQYQNSNTTITTTNNNNNNQILFASPNATLGSTGVFSNTSLNTPNESLGATLNSSGVYSHQINRTNANGKSEFQFKCPVCQNDFQTICSFEYHMQRTHNVTSFGCEICHKPFASLRYVLTDHMRRCHGWKAEQKLHVT